MELLQGHTLLELMRIRPPGNLMHDIVVQLGDAILKLNSTGVIHNDLKLDNVMVLETFERIRVVLIDLGLSKFTGQSPYLPTLSVEAIQNYHSHLDPALAEGGLCSPKTDLYSFGKCLKKIYEFYGCPPYRIVGNLLCSYARETIQLEELFAINCKKCVFKI